MLKTADSKQSLKTIAGVAPTTVGKIPEGERLLHPALKKFTMFSTVFHNDQNGPPGLNKSSVLEQPEYQSASIDLKGPEISNRLAMRPQNVQFDPNLIKQKQIKEITEE